MSTANWRTSPCLLWKGTIDRYGYGKFVRGGRSIRAHRDAYESAYGAIPDGLQIQHLCDEKYEPGDHTYRRCVEPTHLTPGTHKMNTEHMYAVGRAAIGFRNGRYTKPESTVRGKAHPWYGRNQSGEQHPSAKLTDADVRAIHTMWATSRFTQQEIADLFSTPRGSIARILSGHSWKHLYTNPPYPPKA